MGAGSWCVLTASDNEAAVALYRSAGFSEFALAFQAWLTDERPYRVLDGPS